MQADFEQQKAIQNEENIRIKAKIEERDKIIFNLDNFAAKQSGAADTNVEIINEVD